MSASKTAASSLVGGLNTLRLVAAAWVVLSHGARLPLTEISGALGMGQRLAALNNGMFNGVAAVMMFFVISGFVIHRPQAGGRALDPIDHYTRRLTRIAPPLLIMQGLNSFIGPQCTLSFEAILWSVYCEIAYYALYPLLLPLFRRLSIGAIFAVTTALSFVFIWQTRDLLYHSQLDILRLIMIGLPSWILGCLLAERWAAGAILPPAQGIWPWRAAALLLSVVMKMPVTHGPIAIGYPAGHWLFAIFAYFWIGREIAHFSTNPPPRWSEIAGDRSYSLYLAHMPVITLFTLQVVDGAPLAGVFGAGPVAWMVAWACQLTAIVAATWAFFTFVEAPFHKLARRLGRALGQRRTASVASGLA